MPSKLILSLNDSLTDNERISTQWKGKRMGHYLQLNEFSI